MITDRLAKIARRLGLHENRSRGAAADHIFEFLDAMCDKQDALEERLSRVERGEFP